MTVRNFDIQNRSRRGKHDEAAVNGARKARMDGLYPRVKLQVNAELREMIAGVRLDCAIEHIQDLGRSLRPIVSTCLTNCYVLKIFVGQKWLELLDIRSVQNQLGEL